MLEQSRREQGLSSQFLSGGFDEACDAAFHSLLRTVFFYGLSVNEAMETNVFFIGMTHLSHPGLPFIVL